MNLKLFHKITAGVVFAIAFLVYFITVQPSVSFWDCGEFIASSVLMQVPHPPGTPFFLILGRFLSMIPFVDDIGLRVNMISVLSSGFTVMFVYLIGVKLIKFYKKGDPENFFEAIATYISAAIGALSLAFAQTFWFNAVEAEVYAFSTFFIAIVTWLIMTWYEKADEPDNEKYIILIFYLIGLSTGVHLMAVLSIVPIMMIIMIRKYLQDEEAFKKTSYIFLGHAGILLLLAFAMWGAMTSSQPPSYEKFGEVDFRFLGAFAGVSLVYMGIFYKKIFTRNSFYMPIILGGIALVAIYPGLVKYLPNFVSKLGGDNIVLDIIIIIAIIGVMLYLLYYTKMKKQETFNLVVKSFLFAFLGFSTYAMIIIRANEDPPINLNSPKNFSEVVKYLNREQYGDFPTFLRRFSNEPHQRGIFRNYSSDLDFFWTYQMNHMFNRYLLWNYGGRTSTEQDDGVDVYPFNWLGDFLGKPFNIKFGGGMGNSLFGIPFLLGLLGIYFHFKKDWKMAAVLMVMFIFLGYLTAFYQNQQQPQPRERDYFYVGAFFVYSLWIAFGVRGLVDLIFEKLPKVELAKPLASFTIIAAFLLVPVNMLATNYHEQDRADNYVPWDYSYNLLQSVAPNGIIFTNGDNDTFPLWYLQDAVGVRQDVRIVNLSLLNTDWYTLQMKNQEPHGAPKIKMSYSDDQIARIAPSRWEPRKMSINVPQDVIKEYNITDTSVINNNKITWMMRNTAQYGDVKAIRVQDLILLDIINSNSWDRPIYFATTVSDDSKLGLNDYLQMEGMAYRLVPKKNDNTVTYVNPEILKEQLYDEPEGFSKTYRPGFKFRGMDDPSVFLNDNEVRMLQNYRNSFINLALYYKYDENNNSKVIETLNKMEEKLPRKVIPMDYRIQFDVANIYYDAGDVKTYVELASEVQETAEKRLEENPTDFSSSYNPYRLLLDIYEKTGQFDKANELIDKIEVYLPNDPSVKSLKNKFRVLAESAQENEMNKQVPVPDTTQ